VSLTFPYRRQLNPTARLVCKPADCDGALLARSRLWIETAG
jgi:hypothetical protein